MIKYELCIYTDTLGITYSYIVLRSVTCALSVASPSMKVEQQDITLLRGRRERENGKKDMRGGRKLRVVKVSEYIEPDQYTTIREVIRITFTEGGGRA